jgi:hypothetical protein
LEGRTRLFSKNRELATCEEGIGTVRSRRAWTIDLGQAEFMKSKVGKKGVFLSIIVKREVPIHERGSRPLEHEKLQTVDLRRMKSGVRTLEEGRITTP